MNRYRSLRRRVAPRREQLQALGRSARHPLWWLPDPAAQQDEAFRRVWQNLRTIQEVQDGRHDTEEWRSHQGMFALCCVRVPPGALTDDVDDIRNALRQFPFTRIHPDDFLHIPIQEIGFVTSAPAHRNELTRAHLNEFVAMCERPLRDFPRFPIGLGPVNSFADAAFLDVHDGGWLSRIHRRMLDFVPLPPPTRYPYLPHMTIAHYDRAAPIDNLPAVLAEWRDMSLGQFMADRIEVVLLDTGEPFPPFETVHRFELGTTRATGSFPLRPEPGLD